MLQETIRDLASAVAPLGRGARRGCALVLGEQRALALAHTLREREREVELRLPQRAAATATLLGRDRASGLALLAGDFAGVPAWTWAQEPASLGAEVISLADPGSGLRVTRGSVSCERVNLRQRSGRASELIEHTAPVPAGAGGGPIADEHGRVLGISALRGDPGFVLAIPAAVALAAVERISEGREPARLGVALAPPRVAARMRSAVGLPDRPGLLVRDVERGSPAARAGVRTGDLLVRLGDADLESLDALFAVLERSAGQDALKLRVVRGEEESELALSLAQEAS
jgi:S1-C subfamily serine protease